jgi:hypothetical protein
MNIHERSGNANGMISKVFCIASMIVLASFALSSAAWAATCSNASLSGTYGFLHDGTDSNGTPATAAVTQITFDSTTGTFTGETTASHDGVIATEPLTGTYAVASNCTGTGNPTGLSPFSIVVTSTGFLALHLFAEGFAVKQGSPTCTNAGVKGSFGFETTGVFLATGAVAFIGELKLTVNPSGEGVISGRVAASEDGTFLTSQRSPSPVLTSRPGLQGQGYHNAEGALRNALQRSWLWTAGRKC